MRIGSRTYSAQSAQTGRPLHTPKRTLHLPFLSGCAGLCRAFHCLSLTFHCLSLHLSLPVLDLSVHFAASPLPFIPLSAFHCLFHCLSSTMRCISLQFSLPFLDLSSLRHRHLVYYHVFLPCRYSFFNWPLTTSAQAAVSILGAVTHTDFPCASAAIAAKD